MVRTETPICEFDLPAIDFRLKGVDDQYYDLNSLKGENGLGKTSLRNIICTRRKDSISGA